MPFTRPSSLISLFRQSPRLCLIITALLSIILFSSLHTPDPTSASFQWPGLLPSRYPRPEHPHNPLLNSRLSTASELLDGVCNSQGPLKQVYIDPGLTRAQEKRYAHLRTSPQSSVFDRSTQRIMVVSTLRQIHNQLPDLLNTLIVLVTYLGAQRLSFSFIEGPSDDCTSEAFERVIGPTLLSMGIPQNHLHLVTRESKIDFDHHNRIGVLADLRNRALSPLWSGSGPAGKTTKDEVQAVVMLNDVFLRARDILELLHQHTTNGAGITAAWDWWHRRPGYFYDIWVARTIDTGDLFYPITGTSWSPSFDLFETSPSSSAAFKALTPFQAYSAWNGLAVLNPAPFLPPHNVRFRKGDEGKGECTASECTLIAQDFWANGFGRVQVVPSVQLAYDIQPAKETRDDLDSAMRSLGWVDGVPPPEQSTFTWRAEPPTKIRCHPWPEINGKDANVWETTIWVDPFTGMPV